MATLSIAPVSNISSDNDVVTAEIFIAAPPSRVFEAISDPKQTAKWWGRKAVYTLTATQSDVRPGGKWFSEGRGADGKEFRVEGEYLEIDPPHLLVQTWFASFGGMQRTIVRWELEPRDMHGLHPAGPARVGTGTLVKLRHSGFAGNLESAKGHSEGWKRVLGWLQAFIENGETSDNRG